MLSLLAGDPGQDSATTENNNEPGSPTAAAPIESRGFAVELRSGVGRLWGRFEDNRVDGTSIPLEFSAGLHLTDDLILFGEVSDVHAFTSKDLTSHADLYGFGPGLKYYGTPSGFFVRGSAFLSRFRYRNDGWGRADWPGPDLGISGRLAIGKEWRSSSTWRVGLAGELVLGRSWPQDSEAFTHVAAALVGSIVYDSDSGRRLTALSQSTLAASTEPGLAPMRFYMDARLGLGALWVSSGNFLISGASLPLGVAAGMSLTRDLVTFADLTWIPMITHNINQSSTRLVDFAFYGAGLGLKYYLTPDRFFLSGTLAMARLRYESVGGSYSYGSTDTSHWGVWTRLAVGQEWPVSPHWSLGVAGELQIGRMSQGDQTSPPYGTDAYVPKGLSLAVLGSFGSPAQDVAQPTPPLPPTMGTFLSFAIGVGTVSGKVDSRNSDSSDTLDYLSRALPFTLGVGYRFSPGWSGDVSVTYTTVSFKSSDYGQSANDLRTGAAVRWHWLSNGSLRPWVSLGPGVEWLSFYGQSATDVEARGYDLDLQIGGDLRISRGWTLGPYASARVGTYQHLVLKPHWRGGSRSEVDLSFSDLAMHEWFAIGVRGTFASIR